MGAAAETAVRPEAGTARRRVVSCDAFDLRAWRAPAAVMAGLLPVLAAAAGPAAAAVALVALASWLGFAWFPRRVRPRTAALALPLSLSWGALLLGWSGWVMAALLGNWALAATWGGLALGAVRALLPWVHALGRFGRRWGLHLRANPAGAVALAAVLVVLVPQLLLPLCDSDGLRYQVALPKLYLLLGKVVPYPWDVHAALPQTAAPLYLAGLAVAGGETAKWLHALFFLASLATLAEAVHRERWSRPAALGAPLLFAVTPVALAAASAAFIDHIALFHVAVAVLALSRGRQGLALPSIAAAVATKLTAAPAAAALLLVAVARARAGTRQRTLAVGVALVAAAVAPFALRNLCATGDPVFPVGHVLLGKAIPGTSPGRVQKVLDYRSNIPGPLGLSWLPGTAGASRDDVVGAHHLLGLFLLAAVVPIRRARLLVALIVACVVVGLVVHPLARLLMPLFWALAGTSALAMARWLGRGATPATLALAATVFATSTLPLLRLFEPGPYLGGRESRDAFLARVVPGYRAARFVNAQGVGTVMALDFPAPYYLDRPWVAEGTVQEPPLGMWLAAGASVEELLARSRALGVRHILVTPGYGGGTPFTLLPVAPDPASLPTAAAFRARLRWLATLDGVDVFELPPR